MSIYDMPLFSIDNVRRAWDDAFTRIIPLASLPPAGREQIKDYFLEILLRRCKGDDSFPEEPKLINIVQEEEKEESADKVKE